MYDFHLHSEHSMDSIASMEDMVLSAISKNFKSICFTDHVDLDSTAQRIDFSFRESDYFRNINKVKYKYIKDIEVLAGVEIGMQLHLFERYNKLITDYPFDFVLMSIHSVNQMDISGDGFLEGLDPLLALENYYNDMYNSINNYNNFDIVGHFDYIDRYFSDYDKIPRYDEYYYLVRKILELIIKNGKGIELNTAGMRYGLKYFHPKIQILKLYKELGGEIITIGSDAHRPQDLGYEYRTAERLLSDLNFRYIYLFKDRKKYPIHIG